MLPTLSDQEFSELFHWLPFQIHHSEKVTHSLSPTILREGANAPGTPLLEWVKDCCFACPPSLAPVRGSQAPEMEPVVAWGWHRVEQGGRETAEGSVLRLPGSPLAGSTTELPVSKISSFLLKGKLGNKLMHIYFWVDINRLGISLPLIVFACHSSAALHLPEFCMW